MMYPSRLSQGLLFSLTASCIWLWAIYAKETGLLKVPGTPTASNPGRIGRSWHPTAAATAAAAAPRSAVDTGQQVASTDNRAVDRITSSQRRKQQESTQELSRRRSAGLEDTKDLFTQQSLRVSCSAESTRKQTCMFNNVCLMPTANSNSSQPPYLTVVLPAPATDSRRSNRRASKRAVNLLQRHLATVLAGQSKYQGIVYVTQSEDIPFSINLDDQSSHAAFSSQLVSSSQNASLQGTDFKASGTPNSGTDLSGINSSDILIEQGVTVFWRVEKWHQESFGHALLNEAFPLFMVLSNMFGTSPDELPRRLQLLVAADEWTAGALPHVLTELVTHDTQLLHEKIQGLQRQGKAGVCFRHLVIGDGGYPLASRSSLANSGRPEAQTYSVGPSFFSSRNWLAFRKYSLQVAGVTNLDTSAATRPLILLNDKRYHSSSTNQLKTDRRMIIDIDQLASDLRTAYPSADVVAVRFRDLSWPDQLRLISRAAVFITTQGSSAFRWLWLPQGATCVVVGAPEGQYQTDWKSFHELDRWFPLSYVSFEPYTIDVNNTEEYKVSVIPGHWQPKDPEAAKRWWLYNADVRVRSDRLKPMIDQALEL